MGVVVHALNPNTQEGEAGGGCQFKAEQGYIQRLCLRKEGEKVGRREGGTPPPRKWRPHKCKFTSTMFPFLGPWECGLSGKVLSL